MNADRDAKRKIIRYAILGTVFLIAAVMVSIIYRNRGVQSSYLKTQFQEVLHEKENFAEAVLNDVINLPGDSVSFPTAYRWFKKVDLEKKGIHVLLYSDDSLFYWTDNEIPAPELIREDVFREEFIHYGNGWFRVISAEKNRIRAIGLILVKKDYPYQNDYLLNDFHASFEMPPKVSLDTARGTAEIYGRDGGYLFSLNIPEGATVSVKIEMIIFAMALASFIFFLLLLFNGYLWFDFFRKRPVLLMLGFVADAIIFRLILLFFEIPGFIYESELFGPYRFATSFVTPSLGDFFTNSIFWLVIAWLFHDRFAYDTGRLSKPGKAMMRYILLLATALLFFALVSTIKRLVTDSSMDLSLKDLYNIDFYGGMAYVAMAALCLAFFLATARMMCIIAASNWGSFNYILSGAATAFLFFLFSMSAGNSWLHAIVPAAFLFVYFLSFSYFAKKGRGYITIPGAVFYIVYFAVVATYLMDYYHQEKEKDSRKTLAAELASRRDPLMEYEYSLLRNNILMDSSLSVMLSQRGSEIPSDEPVIDYLRQQYFGTFSAKYDLVVTICRQDEVLVIRPAGYIANCFDYFNDLADGQKGEKVGPDLFYLSPAGTNNNYLAVLGFPGEAGDTTRIFVEFYYKYFIETGLGYPDLLIDKKITAIPAITDYSYARYVNGELIYKYGDYSYMLGFDPLDRKDENAYFIEYERYNHFVLKLDQHNYFIISSKCPTFLDLVAPFSYLFILFTLFLLTFLLILLAQRRIKKVDLTFSNKLQISIISVIVVALIVLGIITRSNIIHLYNDKNRDNLNEKTLSVLTELEHKIGNLDEIPDEADEYLSDLLNKFSLIFFSDINLYDPIGNLIASSRPQIFEEQLISMKMQPDAFYKLSYGQSLLYIQDEKIGRQVYLSAYMPFRNNQDEIIAYLNLPYFAKQAELRKELADFLSAYINVYVLLIVLAVMLSVFISRLVTRPLMLIREKLGHIGLGKANEKIEWKKKDEIGSLVEEYNRMIDELARSAELLAQSERESAWREMARQVAHEIKNPLTPMKLSVQYLRKTWNEKPADWEKRLENFTRTIVEQIDSLSEIASEFSDFAKMPLADLQKIDLSDSIRSASELYTHQENIRIELDLPDAPCYVKADRRQLLRVFNNLIQNAVEAIGKEKEGLIGIIVRKEEASYRIEISDTGSGISEEQAARIFTPSFTTKSSGMGLGLAMVRNILASINGKVTFTSQQGTGTTFFIEIPVFKQG